jgi:MFS family permease
LASSAKIPETTADVSDVTASRARTASSVTPTSVPPSSVSPSAHDTERPELRWILAARGLRAFGDGFVSLLLPLYLLSLGYTAIEVGVIATATLLGSGVTTLTLGFHAHRYRTRSLLLAAAALMTATGLSFAVLTDFWPLLVVALVGTLNPSSGDASLFLPLEHSLIAHKSTGHARTQWFARYSLIGAILAALGALCAGVPEWLVHHGAQERNAYRAMFVVYAVLAVACMYCYRRLPPGRRDTNATRRQGLHRSRRVVYTLALLFSIDAFAGGLIVQSMLALWMYQRFDLSPATAGVIFFWTGVFSSLSYLVAVRIANRIGLVYTMVFTHIPSSILLMLVPFAPNLATCIALLLLRSALSQMDVPTRSAFVMSVVPADERAAAASVTSVPRSLAAASSPLLAGYLLSASMFGWPLIAAGAIKIAYDLMLLVAARRMPMVED